MRLLRLLALVVLVTIAANAQQPGYILNIGHSFVRTQTPHEAADFPNIPPGNWMNRSFDSNTCQDITVVLPGVLNHLPYPPTVVWIQLGTTDAEWHGPIGQKTNTPTPTFMACLTNFINVIRSWCAQSGCSNATYIVTNTPPFNIKTLLPPARYNDTRPFVEAYNQAEADPNTGLQAMYPGVVFNPDIWTPTVLSTGWANPTYITYIDPNDSAGWPEIDSDVQCLLYQLDGATPCE